MGGVLTLYTDHVASISCFNYKHIGNPKMRAWVERFCAFHMVTGVICIDFFMDGNEGEPYAIECNPRFSSNILNFYNSPTAGRAFLEPELCAKAGVTEIPLPTAAESCWTATDLYYAPENVLPFLALHFLHIPVLLARNVYRGNRW